MSLVPTVKALCQLLPRMSLSEIQQATALFTEQTTPLAMSPALELCLPGSSAGTKKAPSPPAMIPLVQLMNLYGFLTENRPSATSASNATKSHILAIRKKIDDLQWGVTLIDYITRTLRWFDANQETAATESALAASLVVSCDLLVLLQHTAARSTTSAPPPPPGLEQLMSIVMEGSRQKPQQPPLTTDSSFCALSRRCGWSLSAFIALMYLSNNNNNNNTNNNSSSAIGDSTACIPDCLFRQVEIDHPSHLVLLAAAPTFLTDRDIPADLVATETWIQRVDVTASTLTQTITFATDLYAYYSLNNFGEYRDDGWTVANVVVQAVLIPALHSVFRVATSNFWSRCTPSSLASYSTALAWLPAQLESSTGIQALTDYLSELIEHHGDRLRQLELGVKETTNVAWIAATAFVNCLTYGCRRGLLSAEDVADQLGFLHRGLATWRNAEDSNSRLSHNSSVSMSLVLADAVNGPLLCVSRHILVEMAQLAMTAAATRRSSSSMNSSSCLLGECPETASTTTESLAAMAAIGLIDVILATFDSNSVHQVSQRVQLSVSYMASMLVQRASQADRSQMCDSVRSRILRMVIEHTRRHSGNVADAWIVPPVEAVDSLLSEEALQEALSGASCGILEMRVQASLAFLAFADVQQVCQEPLLGRIVSAALSLNNQLPWHIQLKVVGPLMRVLLRLFAPRSVADRNTAQLLNRLSQTPSTRRHVVNLFRLCGQAIQLVLQQGGSSYFDESGRSCEPSALLTSILQLLLFVAQHSRMHRELLLTVLPSCSSHPISGSDKSEDSPTTTTTSPATSLVVILLVLVGSSSNALIVEAAASVLILSLEHAYLERCTSGMEGSLGRGLSTVHGGSGPGDAYEVVRHVTAKDSHHGLVRMLFEGLEKPLALPRFLLLRALFAYDTPLFLLLVDPTASSPATPKSNATDTKAASSSKDGKKSRADLPTATLNKFLTDFAALKPTIASRLRLQAEAWSILRRQCHFSLPLESFTKLLGDLKDDDPTTIIPLFCDRNVLLAECTQYLANYLVAQLVRMNPLLLSRRESTTLAPSRASSVSRAPATPASLRASATGPLNGTSSKLKSSAAHPISSSAETIDAAFTVIGTRLEAAALLYVASGQRLLTLADQLPINEGLSRHEPCLKRNVVSFRFGDRYAYDPLNNSHISSKELLVEVNQFASIVDSLCALLESIEALMLVVFSDRDASFFELTVQHCLIPLLKLINELYVPHPLVFESTEKLLVRSLKTAVVVAHAARSLHQQTTLLALAQSLHVLGREARRAISLVGAWSLHTTVVTHMTLLTSLMYPLLAKQDVYRPTKIFETSAQLLTSQLDGDVMDEDLLAAVHALALTEVSNCSPLVCQALVMSLWRFASAAIRTLSPLETLNAIGNRCLAVLDLLSTSLVYHPEAILYLSPDAVLELVAAVGSVDLSAPSMVLQDGHVCRTAWSALWFRFLEMLEVIACRHSSLGVGSFNSSSRQLANNVASTSVSMHPGVTCLLPGTMATPTTVQLWSRSLNNFVLSTPRVFVALSAPRQEQQGPLLAAPQGGAHALELQCCNRQSDLLETSLVSRLVVLLTTQDELNDTRAVRAVLAGFNNLRRTSSAVGYYTTRGTTTTAATSSSSPLKVDVSVLPIGSPKDVELVLIHTVKALLLTLVTMVEGDINVLGGIGPDSTLGLATSSRAPLLESLREFIVQEIQVVRRISKEENMGLVSPGLRSVDTTDSAFSEGEVSSAADWSQGSLQHHVSVCHAALQLFVMVVRQMASNFGSSWTGGTRDLTEKLEANLRALQHETRQNGMTELSDFTSQVQQELEGLLASTRTVHHGTRR